MLHDVSHGNKSNNACTHLHERASIERRESPRWDSRKSRCSASFRRLSFPVVYLVARCRQPAREPRSHNNKRSTVRLFKGRPPRVSSSLSLSLSHSRRVVVAAAVCRRCPSLAVGEARSRPRGAPTSRRFNAQRTRVSRRRITTFVGRPPPLLTDKCHAARRGTRSIICY